MSKIVSYFRR